tara:strand:- start:1118 stop:1621 length:504 start_codon:yes stop_codon:yes gene_type:complete
MASEDTFTGKKVRDTYTKILQVNDDNELLDGVGGQVSPILKAGATIEGELNVEGAIYRNGVAIGTSTDSYWSENAEGELTRDSNVGVGESDPSAKLALKSQEVGQDFFIIRKKTITGDGLGSSTRTVFKINDEGVMELGRNETEPTAKAGAIYYNSTEKEFYLGYGE